MGTRHNQSMCDEAKLIGRDEDSAPETPRDRDDTAATDPRDEIIIRLQQAWIRDAVTLDDLPAAA